MPKIQNVSTPVTARAASTTQAAPKKPAAKPAQAAQTQAAGWGAKTTKYPEVATTAKAFVDAYAAGAKAMTQFDMVESSVGTNKAADAMLRHVAGELASQLGDRGKDAAGAKVLKDLDAFFKKTGPAQHYHLDPERGTMAALEDNGDRMTKVLGQLEKLAAQLEKVNAEPAGETQQAYNRSAGGDAVLQEARFALAFQKAYNEAGDDAVITKAQTFFKALPKNVDSQIESRGGSLEPLERAGGTATALADFAKKL